MEPQVPPNPQEEPRKSTSDWKAITSLVIAGISGISLVGMGVFLSATGNIAIGIPILSTVAGIFMPSPVFTNSTKN